MEMPKMPMMNKKEEIKMPTMVEKKPIGREKDELEKTFDMYIKNTGKKVYSYSRLNTVNQCDYLYYQTYVKKNRGEGNVYSMLGGISHDIVEDFTNGKLKSNEEMLEKFNVGVKNAEIAGMTFPSEKIKTSFMKNMRLFFLNYRVRDGLLETKTEDFIMGSFGSELNQIILKGYIDEVNLLSIDEDGVKHYEIVDHKSSSMFRSDKMVGYGRQLILYKYMFEKMHNCKVDRLAWNMMKYCEVSTPTNIKPTLNKMKIAELKEFTKLMGREDEKLKKAEIIQMIDDIYHSQFCKEFGINSVKTVVMERQKVEEYLSNEEFYEVEDHYMKYEHTDELEMEAINYIIQSVEKSMELELMNELSIQPCKIGKEEFFCVNLCNLKKECLFLKIYLQNKLK